MAKTLNFKKISRVISLLLLFFFICWQFSKYKIKAFPKLSEISSRMYAEPVQTETSRRSFLFEYFDKEYLIQPKFDYELSGMIVTHNNISSITDAYHDSKSVDFKDLCVIWGDNLKNNAFRKLEFWSAPWTCFYRYSDPNVVKKFNSHQLSNNHLLSDKKSVRKKIKSVKVGDQIKLSGMLVDYFPRGYSERLRKTSTVRTDTGNGACEVVFVEKFEIVKVSNKLWSKLNYLFSSLFYLAFVTKVLSFIIIHQIE